MSLIGAGLKICRAKSKATIFRLGTHGSCVLVHRLDQGCTNLPLSWRVSEQILTFLNEIQYMVKYTKAGFLEWPGNTKELDTVLEPSYNRLFSYRKSGTDLSYFTMILAGSFWVLSGIKKLLNSIWRLTSFTLIWWWFSSLFFFQSYENTHVSPLKGEVGTKSVSMQYLENLCPLGHQTNPHH